MHESRSIIKYLIISLLLIICGLTPSKVCAQDTFFAEMGVGGGGAFSLGDINGILFKNLKPYGSVFFKYKFNGYLELRTQIEGGLVGVSDLEGYKKHSTTLSAQVLAEYNFFNFGSKTYNEYYSWAAPYIFAGLGVVFFEEHAAMAVPMGIGGKFRLSSRVNVGLCWTASKVLHDDFDGVDDPIGLNKNFWNNRDWYSSAQVWISFNFLKICAPCRNGVAYF